jgi:hypothetical protein
MIGPYLTHAAWQEPKYSGFYTLQVSLTEKKKLTTEAESGLSD